MKERAGLANKHTQSQRRPVRLCRREREEREKGRESRGSKREGDTGRASTEVKGGEVSFGRKREGRKLNRAEAAQEGDRENGGGDRREIKEEG